MIKKQIEENILKYKIIVDDLHLLSKDILKLLRVYYTDDVLFGFNSYNDFLIDINCVICDCDCLAKLLFINEIKLRNLWK